MNGSIVHFTHEQNGYDSHTVMTRPGTPAGPCHADDARAELVRGAEGEGAVRSSHNRRYVTSTRQTPGIPPAATRADGLPEPLDQHHVADLRAARGREAGTVRRPREIDDVLPGGFRQLARRAANDRLHPDVLRIGGIDIGQAPGVRGVEGVGERDRVIDQRASSLSHRHQRQPGPLRVQRQLPHQRPEPLPGARLRVCRGRAENLRTYPVLSRGVADVLSARTAVHGESLPIRRRVPDPPRLHSGWRDRAPEAPPQTLAGSIARGIRPVSLTPGTRLTIGRMRAVSARLPLARLTQRPLSDPEGAPSEQYRAQTQPPSRLRRHRGDADDDTVTSDGPA